jgi:methylamine dehydrogenase accessory protein MauD
VVSPVVGMTYQVGKLPYAVLIDELGIVRAKGLVNSREHLESLLVAKETGYASIQAYLDGDGKAANEARPPRALAAVDG